MASSSGRLRARRPGWPRPGRSASTDHSTRETTMAAPYLRLGVNIDHVATLRNARDQGYPDPVRAAHAAILAGADGITAHLREDRRHIRDADVERLKQEILTPLNFEIAATSEMVGIARHVRPHAACLVPEKRT